MSKENQIEIEELLSALMDDEATERQKNEFQRLCDHDSSIADQLQFLQQQKLLLGALPIEPAPASMIEDISSALQRKLILRHAQKTATTVRGTTHLLMQRFLTTAAMLLLPLGLLSFVVYEIMKPASVGPVDYVPTDEILVQADPVPLTPTAAAKADMLPFEGILTFRTDRQMTVSNYIEKVIFDQGLMSLTLPNRTVDVSTYQITAPPTKIAALIDSLKGLWSQTQNVTLDVLNGSESNTILIANIQPEQVKTLTAEDSADMLVYLAAQYAQKNDETGTAFAKADATDMAELPFEDIPPLTMPILTGRYSLTQEPAAPTAPTVRLRIHVKRKME